MDHKAESLAQPLPDRSAYRGLLYKAFSLVDVLIHLPRVLPWAKMFAALQAATSAKPIILSSGGQTQFQQLGMTAL
jgi:hypothetical protein